MPSRKLRNAAAGSEEELNIDMSPMIDMVFLLLMFFLVAASVIVVKQDPGVEPPIAKNSKKTKDGKGRIVINIHEDGSFYAESVSLTFADEAALEEYVMKQKILQKENGNVALIHIRAHKKVSFKYVRTVIRASANAGVDNVIFAVFGFEKK